MRRLAALAALLLAGCGQHSQPGASQGNIAEKTIEAAPSNAAMNETAPANQAAAATDNALGALPPASSPLRFVGLWATSQANCASKPWRFTETKVTATDGPTCSIYKVTKAPGGYDLAATCPGKKPVETDLIRLRFAESARAMLVESNAINPTGLVYCGKES